MRILAPIFDLVFIGVDDFQKQVGFSYERVIAKKRSITVGVDVLKIHHTYVGQYHEDRIISLFLTYRFYPFNKNKKYPQGFHASPAFSLGGIRSHTGYYKGYYDVYYQQMWYTDEEINRIYSKSIFIGVGGELGWQYFMGKRKRFNLDFSLSFAGNRNFLILEGYKKASVESFFTMAPGFYLGYTFGKVKS